MQLKSSDNILDLNNEKIEKKIFIFENYAQSIRKNTIQNVLININKIHWPLKKGKHKNKIKKRGEKVHQKDNKRGEGIRNGEMGAK